MVNRQVVLETIKKMRASGLDNADIAKTLRDIGIPDNEIEEFLLELEDSGAPMPKPQTTGETEERGVSGEDGEEAGDESLEGEGLETDAQDGGSDADLDLAEKTALRVKEHLDRRLEEDALQDSELQNRLDSHSEKLDSVHDNVQTLHGKIDSLSGGPSNRDLSKSLAGIEERLSALEAQVNDLKALSTASKSLLSKILETDRRILGEKD